MVAARAVFSSEPPPSANDRWKGGFRARLWSSMILAAASHFGVLAYWPAMSVDDFTVAREELTAIELPPDVEIPAPPGALPRPARPVLATGNVSAEITIAPTTFEAYPTFDALPPPPTYAPSEGASGEPYFTPFEVAPAILNRAEVAQALARAYPAALRTAGIGARVRIHFFIDEEGRVERILLDQGSGFPALDQAALSVAGVYRFRPALNRDRRVPVWVSLPIDFSVR